MSINNYKNDSHGVADHTIAEMINRYIDEILSSRPITARNQMPHLKWWEKQIGSHLLEQVRPPLLIECRKELLGQKTVRAKPRQSSTVNRYFATLSRVFSIAIKEWEWIDKSPLEHLSKLKEPAGRTRFLSQEEIQRLLNTCRRSRNKDLYIAVIIALSTCARQMEVISLRWEDVNLTDGIIFLKHTKNGTSRAVPLQGYALELIKERYHASECRRGLIFPARKKPNQPTNLRASWQKALCAAKIQDFRWHDLRHTGASYLAMQGASLAETLRGARA